MPTTVAQQQIRRRAITQILTRNTIVRQTELVQLLRARGLHATQSSVSRDLKQLGISKLDTGYAKAESLKMSDGQNMPLLSEFVQGIKTAGGHLTVIQTSIGAAQRVAVFLDRSGWSEIVGTVSGDDTIFVATRNNADQRRLLAKLRSQFMAS